MSRPTLTRFSWPRFSGPTLALDELARTHSGRGVRTASPRPRAEYGDRLDDVADVLAGLRRPDSRRSVPRGHLQATAHREGETPPFIDRASRLCVGGGGGPDGGGRHVTWKESVVTSSGSRPFSSWPRAERTPSYGPGNSVRRIPRARERRQALLGPGSYLATTCGAPWRGAACDGLTSTFHRGVAAIRQEVIPAHKAAGVGSGGRDPVSRPKTGGSRVIELDASTVTAAKNMERSPSTGTPADRF